MLWVGLGAMVVAGLLVVTAVFRKRPADLGSVSDRWIVEQRRER
jgi:hypothetical protein